MTWILSVFYKGSLLGTIVYVLFQQLGLCFFWVSPCVEATRFHKPFGPSPSYSWVFPRHFRGHSRWSDLVDFRDFPYLNF